MLVQRDATPLLHLPRRRQDVATGARRLTEPCPSESSARSRPTRRTPAMAAGNIFGREKQPTAAAIDGVPSILYRVEENIVFSLFLLLPVVALHFSHVCSHCGSNMLLANWSNQLVCRLLHSYIFTFFVSLVASSSPQPPYLFCCLRGEDTRPPPPRPCV